MVGATIEEVAPRRILKPADALSLAVLLAFAIALHVWLIVTTATTARDGIRFARAALSFEHRGVSEVLKDTKVCPDPPLFPLSVLTVSKIVRATSMASLPEQMLTSAQIAASIAGVLLVIPSYWLGRMLFERRSAGFAAALLFQALPTVAHITADALADSSALLAVLTALVCGVRAVRTRSTTWFLATGVASGLGYLVRPEGVLAAPALTLVVVSLTLRGSWPLRLSAGRLTALVTGTLIVATPYMILIGGISNKPSVNEPLQKLLPIKMLLSQRTTTPGLYADWYSGHGSQASWALTAIVKESIKTSHYGACALGVLGLLLWWKRMDSAFAVVLVAGGLQVLLLFLLAMKPMPADLSPGSEAVPPYVSERHTLLIAYLACLFSGAALAPLAKMISPLPRGGAAALLMALIASALPAALKPLHANREGHYHAGRFLADKLGPGDALIDPFEWANYYSGRSLYGVPQDPPEHDLVARWVVWEPTAGTKQNPHSRLPRLEVARNVVTDGANPPQLVYHWPESMPPEQAKVVVYRQAVK